MRWYLRYALSYRDLEEMMEERGLAIDHTTITRCSTSGFLPARAGLVTIRCEAAETM